MQLRSLEWVGVALAGGVFAGCAASARGGEAGVLNFSRPPSVPHYSGPVRWNSNPHASNRSIRHDLRQAGSVRPEASNPRDGTMLEGQSGAAFITSERMHPTTGMLNGVPNSLFSNAADRTHAPRFGPAFRGVTAVQGAQQFSGRSFESDQGRSLFTGQAQSGRAEVPQCSIVRPNLGLAEEDVRSMLPDVGFFDRLVSMGGNSDPQGTTPRSVRPTKGQSGGLPPAASNLESGVMGEGQPGAVHLADDRPIEARVAALFNAFPIAQGSPQTKALRPSMVKFKVWIPSECVKRNVPFQQNLSSVVTVKISVPCRVSGVQDAVSPCQHMTRADEEVKRHVSTDQD